MIIIQKPLEVYGNTTKMISNLCDYDDLYILVKRIIAVTVAGDDAAARRADERNKRVTFKNSIY